MDLQKLDLNLFATLEQLWLCRSVSLAAERLNLAQSTVSAALRRLRHQLGDELFVWNGSEMVPTARTSTLMPEILTILHKIRALLGGDDLTGLHRRFVISTVDYVVQMLGPNLLCKVQAQAPNVGLDFAPIRYDWLVESNLQSVDLFIVPVEALPAKGFIHRQLFREQFVCIAAEGNEAVHANMTEEELLSMPHVGFSLAARGQVSHEARSWQRAGRQVHLAMTLTEYLIFPQIVAHSSAVAIVPQSVAVDAMSRHSIKWVIPPLHTDPMEVVLAWQKPKDEDVVHKWLRDIIHEIISEPVS